MLFYNKHSNLNIGLVKENFAIVKLKDIRLWRKRGFKYIMLYPIFGYIPKPTEVIMLGKPQKIEEFGLESFKGCKIIDISTCLGTYGMGSPDFVGFKLQGESGIRWLTYCVWSAGFKILLDNKVLESNSDDAKYYKPWIKPNDFDNSEKALKQTLSDMTIQQVNLTDTELTITLLDSSSNLHKIFACKHSNKFPPLGRKKRNAYDDGNIGDYWLVSYDGSDFMMS